MPFQELKVIFVTNKKQAEAYIDELYSDFVEVTIVAADMSYPKDKEKREKIWEYLKNDKRVSIVMFNSENLKYAKSFASNKIIVIDRILENFDLSKEDFILLIYYFLTPVKHMIYNRPRNISDLEKWKKNILSTE
tara:strand:- start:257 stop:661 length:405 start_codon:yes stop_codon:yes gene_type:complete